MYSCPYIASSQLSNIGTNSLKSLNRYISDREVYEKQQKNYNIISVQPKEYQDTIKMFPKYHLEDQDHHYFRKMQIERELASKLMLNRDSLRHGRTVSLHPAPQQQMAVNPESSPAVRPMRGKYLNNVDEVADIL
jgi:hypothetical protein